MTLEFEKRAKREGEHKREREREREIAGELRRENHSAASEFRLAGRQ
jgi:hypothetical protein